MSSYSFVLVADPQFGMVSQEASTTRSDGTVIHSPILDPDLRNVSKQKLYEMELEFSNRAVRAINSLHPQPKFVVICGDLVQVPPNKDKILNKKQVDDFKSVFSKINSDIKIVYVCGNHDVGDTTNEETIEKYRENFGNDYFSFMIEEDKYIVLNSQYYKDPSSVPEIVKQQDKWLKEELSGKNQHRHTIVFTHIPPFIHDPKEPSAYFNFETEIREQLLSQTIMNGINYWFCGHYHRNAGGVYQKDGKRLEVVTTAGVGGNVTTNPDKNPLEVEGVGQLFLDAAHSGFRIISVSKEGVIHQFKNLTEYK